MSKLMFRALIVINTLYFTFVTMYVLYVVKKKENEHTVTGTVHCEYKNVHKQNKLAEICHKIYANTEQL